MDQDKTKKKPLKKLADVAKNVSKYDVELIKRTEEKEADLEKRLNQLLELQKAYTTIHSIMSIKDMLPKIAETVVNILGYDCAFVITFDVDKKLKPETAFFSKPVLELAKEVEISAKQMLTAAQIQENRDIPDTQPAIGEDEQEVTVEPQLPSEYAAVQKMLDARNMITVPLTMRQNLLGNILAFTHRDDIPETDEQPLWILSIQASIAIDSLRLYDEALLNEQKLRESHEMSRITLENAVTGVSIVQDGKFKYANSIFEEMLGYTINELTGKPTLDFIHPDDRQRVYQEAVASLKGKIKSPHEFRIIKKDGSTIWVMEKVASIKYEAKRAAMAIALDVTELKHAEQALRESEEKLKVVFNAIKDGIVVTDVAINMMQVNEAARRLSGYPSIESMIGKNALDFITPEDIEKALKPLSDGQKGKGSFIDWGDFKLRAKTGEVFDAEIGVNALQDASGVLTGFVTIIHDVTERKRMMSQLRESEAKLRFMFESIGEGIVVTDLNGKVIDENMAGLRMFGYNSKEEVIGMDGLSVIAEKDREEAKTALIKTLETNEATPKEFTLTTRTGEEFKGEISTTLVRDNLGNPSGLISIVRDITARKKMEQYKSDFVALVSHQLKTPVAGIRGYVENMLDGLTGELNEKQRRYLSDMRALCLRNYRLISDLLNTSMIERGMLTMDIAPVKLNDIVNVVIKDYYGKIEEKGLTLRATGMNASEIVVLADRDKLVESLSNIVNNCIKFTDEGYIAIKIGQDNEYGIIEVHDTGRGMSSEILQELFKRDKILSGGPVAGGGAGLGLYIAKGFMKAQNGDIIATSTIGKGSSFTLTIPLSREP